jgi:hypothetical protein
MHSRTALVGGLSGGLLVGCLLVAGCSASNGASAASDAVPRAASGGSAVGSGQSNLAPGANKAQAPGTAPAAGGAGKPLAKIDPASAAGRQVIRTGTISLSVPNVTGTAADVRRITAGAGGYSSSEDTETDHADFTLQVPQPMLDSALDQLAGLGKVTNRGEQAQDVTDQLVDVNSRVASQQASVDRVRALLAKATSIGDIVTIEGELANREADLESLEQRQAELSGQVAMSTVTVHLARSDAPPPPAQAASGGFLGGLSAGWHSFVAVVGVVLVVFGAVLPYLLGLGIPVALVWWLLRRRRISRPAPVVHPDAG